jgi:GDP-4-dehydro-6-deoxy-D-mannose reductase
LRILITGITGFIGSYLVRLALDRGHDVFGNTWSSEGVYRIKDLKKRIKLVKCDITNAKEVLNLVKKSKPDIIFHLAAQSFPSVSWKKPFDTMVANAGGTINVLEAVKTLGISPKIVVACSSDEYGKTFIEKGKKHEKVKETDPIYPINPYSVSKVTQELLSKQYFENFGMKIIPIRIFNTTGPGKTGDAAANFAEQIVRIEQGKASNPMLVGNLDTERDLSDVHDMCEGLWAAAERGIPGQTYNISTGRTVRTKDILEKLISLAHTKVEFVQDPAKIRPADVPYQCGDSSKFVKETGWSPKFDIIKQTLPEILNWWRKR